LAAAAQLAQPHKPDAAFDAGRWFGAGADKTGFDLIVVPPEAARRFRSETVSDMHPQSVGVVFTNLTVPS
jgi:hypothetical protein